MVNPFFFMGVLNKHEKGTHLVRSYFKDIQCDYIASREIKCALEMQ